MVERKWPDRIIRRQGAEQDQAAFGGRVLRIQFKRRLQAVQAFLPRVHRRAHPDPVSRVILIDFQQARQQISGARPVFYTKCFNSFLKHGFFGHALSLAQADGWDKSPNKIHRLRTQVVTILLAAG